MVFENKEIDTSKIFVFTMHNTVCIYLLHNEQLPLFIKYFDVHNPLIRFENDSLQLLL
jgi:hypothetical protein